MTAVTVVVPWRGGCEHRQAALYYAVEWWKTHHPGYQVVVATDSLEPDAPWCKALAVHNGIDAADGDMIVVADADVICDGVADAVAAVEHGDYGWAVPHYAVYRLTPDSTTLALQGGPLPDTRLPRSLLREKIAEVHRGVQGGGMVVMRRDTYRRVPLDARFRGWGQEDLAWGWALKRVVGPPSPGPSRLLHLWHPPQERSTRAKGSAESMELWGRYRRSYTAAEVLALLDEPGARVTG
jgi:hypothetical protein